MFSVILVPLSPFPRKHSISRIAVCLLYCLRQRLVSTFGQSSLVLCVVGVFSSNLLWSYHPYIVRLLSGPTLWRPQKNKKKIYLITRLCLWLWLCLSFPSICVICNYDGKTFPTPLGILYSPSCVCICRQFAPKIMQWKMFVSDKISWLPPTSFSIYYLNSKILFKNIRYDFY